MDSELALYLEYLPLKLHVRLVELLLKLHQALVSLTEKVHHGVVLSDLIISFIKLVHVARTNRYLLVFVKEVTFTAFDGTQHVDDAGKRDLVF